jgi:hypothetical protein
MRIPLLPSHIIKFTLYPLRIEDGNHREEKGRQSQSISLFIINSVSTTIYDKTSEEGTANLRRQY